MTIILRKISAVYAVGQGTGLRCKRGTGGRQRRVSSEAKGCEMRGPSRLTTSSGGVDKAKILRADDCAGIERAAGWPGQPHSSSTGTKKVGSPANGGSRVIFHQKPAAANSYLRLRGHDLAVSRIGDDQLSWQVGYVAVVSRSASPGRRRKARIGGRACSPNRRQSELVDILEGEERCWC